MMTNSLFVAFISYISQQALSVCLQVCVLLQLTYWKMKPAVQLHLNFFFKWLTATIRLQCQGCACCHSFYKKLNIQQYSSGVSEQVIFISLLCLIRSLTIMLTCVLSSLSLPQGRIVCCVPLECVLARIVGKTSEKKVWICPHKANSRRSGICMLLSSAHPQGIGPPRVRFKKVKGKETATSMHRSAQNSSLPSEFLLQSGWVPKFFQALRCYFMDLVCRRSQ